jgi:hypothetical protein
MADNVVEIVGQVLRQRQRGQPDIAVTGISPTRAVTTQLVVQVNEEDGDAYGLRLVFPPRASAPADLIAALAEGERLRVRGRLGWRETYDLRFATAEDPLGRPTRELVVTVLAVERAEAAAIDGSWVRLQGTIWVPPQIRRHELAPSLELARTSLQVTVRQPSSRPGSRAEFVQQETIPIDVPLELPGRGAVLRAGNQVVVEGRLERFRQRINLERNPLVGRALAPLKTQMETEVAQLAGEEQRSAARRGARAVRQLVYEDRLRLRAGYVELVAGTPLDDVEEAIHNRETWTRTIQARRAARQHRKVARVTAAQPAPVLRVVDDAGPGNDAPTPGAPPGMIEGATET